MTGVDSIPVALVDTQTVWGLTQEQMLFLARQLTASPGFAPCICAPEGSELLSCARDEGIQVCALPASAPTGLRALWRMLRHFHKFNSLILHSFSEKSLTLCQRVAALRAESRVQCLHSALWLEDFPPKFVLRGPWRKAKKIVCGSQLISNLLQDAGLARDTLDCILPGYDTANLPQHHEREDGRFIFMVMEPLEESNNLHVLIRAMAALWQRQDLPPWELRIVGHGCDFNSLLEEARNLGVASRLAILGVQNSVQVMMQADAILATSSRAQGSWPAPALAWTMGIPLLYNSVAGNNELGCGLECGLMLPMNDPQFVAQIMIRCMTDTALREKLGALGTAMRPRIDSSRMSAQYTQVYSRLAGEINWPVPEQGEIPANVPETSIKPESEPLTDTKKTEKKVCCESTGKTECTPEPANTPKAECTPEPASTTTAETFTKPESAPKPEHTASRATGIASEGIVGSANHTESASTPEQTADSAPPIPPVRPVVTLRTTPRVSMTTSAQKVPTIAAASPLQAERARPVVSLQNPVQKPVNTVVRMSAGTDIQKTAVAVTPPPAAPAVQSAAPKAATPASADTRQASQSGADATPAASGATGSGSTGSGSSGFGATPIPLLKK